MYYALLLLSMMSMSYYLFAIYAAKRFFSSRPKPETNFQPPISILKPVCGMEPMAYENFASFCKQSYPLYQIIFGVKEASDPIINVINKIITDFPQTDIQLVICAESQGSNPKINSLMTMKKSAKYSFLLISDSDIRVGSSYLNEMIQLMRDETVGIVTSIYRSIASKWLSIIGALIDSTEYMPGVLCAKQLDQIKWTLGCSVLIRETALNAIGGMQVIANHLAEDLLLGKLVTERGYQIALSNYVIEHVLEHQTLLSIIRGKIRRDRGILVYNPWSYLSLMFTFGSANSLLFLLVSHASSIGLIVFSLVWGTKLFKSWLISAQYLNDRSGKKFSWLSPLQECFSFVLWLYVFLTSKIYWRGSYFKVEKGGRLIRA